MPLGLGGKARSCRLPGDAACPAAHQQTRKSPCMVGRGVVLLQHCSSPRLDSGAPAFCCPGLVIVSFPAQFSGFYFFCLFQAASNLFPIITSCSRSNANSAARTPGEILVCCPWSRAPSDRCVFLPPSTPACSPDPTDHTAPLPVSKAPVSGSGCRAGAAGGRQRHHRGHLLPPDGWVLLWGRK